MNSPSKKSSPPSAHHNRTPVDAFEAAYERAYPRAAQIPAAELAVFNIDVPYAVGIALDTVPRLKPLRSALAQLPGFDISQVDELESCAMALAYTHGRYLAAVLPAPDLAQVQVQAADARDALHVQAVALAARELIDPSAVDGTKSASGYRALANNLLKLCAVFRENAARLVGKTPVTPDEVARAADLAQQLLRGIGRREGPRTGTSEAALERQQVFTLFTRACSQVQRGVQYLRWDAGDAAAIAPSIYEHRPAASDRRGGESPPAAEPAAPPPPTQPDAESAPAK
jgi:hypothetical protein